MIVAASAPPLLASLALVVVAGALVAYLSQRVGSIPVLGFLAAGVLVGPNGLALVDDVELVDQIAEIGVLLLLFTIGLELSLGELRRMGAVLAVGGTLQVGVTILVVAGGLALAGVDWSIGVYTGFLVALSSTAVVLKLLTDRRETASPRGRLGLSLLIFQDLAVVGMVLMVPMLGTGGGSAGDIVWALVKAVGVVVVVLVGARRVMPRVLEAVGRICSPEVFLMTVLGICFGTAYATALLDVNVSLGAFLAGLVVSESRYSRHALNEVLPLQILFSAAFFVSIGMLLDLGFVVDEWLLVLGVVAAIVGLKTLVTAGAARVVGRSWPLAASGALLLAQVGEFSFVLERAGREAGLTPADLGDRGSQAFIAATVVLMASTPGLAALGRRVEERAGGRGAARPDDVAPTGDTGPGGGAGSEVGRELDGLRDHVVLAGYGRRTSALATALELAGVPFVIATLSPGGATHAQRLGRPVVLSDPSQLRTLQQLGVGRARALAAVDHDPAELPALLEIVRGAAPDLPVVVRTPTGADADEMDRHDVHAVADTDAVRDALATHLLAGLGLPGDRIDGIVEAARQRTGPLLTGIPDTGGTGGGTGGGDVPVGAATLDPSAPVAVAVLDGCEHAGGPAEVWPSAPGCEECLAEGHSWVHLRICMTCGHVGCCDSSPGRHAQGHWHQEGHPVVRSAEAGETWAWCFADERIMETAPPDRSEPAP